MEKFEMTKAMFGDKTPMVNGVMIRQERSSPRIPMGSFETIKATHGSVALMDLLGGATARYVKRIITERLGVRIEALNMNKKYVITLLVMAMSGCGDYESVSIPSLELSEEQAQTLMGVTFANLTCAAISRYSNDLGSPIEGNSHTENAKTAFEVIKRSNLKDRKDNWDEFYNKMKTDIYNGVITDLNNVQSLNDFYNHVFPQYQNMLNVKKIEDCADVGAVTRRVLDPLLVI
ncbi:hypothetical protein NDJ08_04010 [Vibrio alginolyticus]|uniref:hypothetical protein n=1 Tax=Vibrio harveyi group TaxID=717610 RepID=UPI00215F1433|nr:MULTISPECIES: hypothetical protein [Vibrio harveyi group]MCS0165778.1 hypothetical protein [Vibrio alginolyticus]